MQIAKIQTTKFYKRLAIIFSVFVLIILALVIYFSFSKTIITAHLIPRDVTTNFNINLKGEVTEEEAISGENLAGFLLSTTVAGSQNFTNTNNLGEQVAAQATGTVTIYNNWSENQPLMATTRLLTPDGILFRIKDRIDVPAGGKIENVEVYADQPGSSGNIGPTTFTIPGLWPGLQEKIYAENSEPMTGGLRETKLVTQKIINETSEVLKGELIEKAKTKLEQTEEIKNHQYQKLGQAVATITLEQEASASEGDEADSFDINMKLQAIVVNLDETQLLNIAQNHLTEELPSDEKLYKSSHQTISYSVEEYNLKDQTANIKVTFVAGSIPRTSNPMFDKENLINKNSQAINAYFSNFEEILSVNIRFSPFWLTTTPKLKDHIEVRIVEET